MSLRFLTAGESHGPALNAILEGMPAGLELDAALINRELLRRKSGFGAGERMQIEKDRVDILSGVMARKTTGAPISILLRNADHANWKGKKIKPRTKPRPGHADLTGAIKYGFSDFRQSLERASARETAMRVAVGAICKTFLKEFGITTVGFVREISGVRADTTGMDYEEISTAAEGSIVRCPDETAASEIEAKIRACKESGDTLGGIIEAAVLNLPVGLGSYVHHDRRLDAKLAKAIMSIPAVKGVDIGDAFENARQSGLTAHDALYLNGKKVVRKSNRAGGIEGGISNGEPIVVRAAMKPIATTLTPQASVDLQLGEEAETRYERSDHCPVPRAVPVVEAVVAIVIANALIEKLGGDSIGEMVPRFESLKQANLDDVRMDGEKKVWWE